MDPAGYAPPWENGFDVCFSTEAKLPTYDPMLKPKGKASNKWLLEGRYLSMDWEGTMMGQPIVGWGVMGYDNFRKEYVSAMGNTMGTSIEMARGFIDLTGKQITLYGTMDEPAMDQIDKPVKYVTRIVDADHYVFEIYDPDIEDGGGGSPLVISVSYTRKKK